MLIEEGRGVASHVLSSLGVDAQAVREETLKIVQAGPAMVSMGKMPLTPRCRKVVECAIGAANELSHGFVGTEHLLLGLLKETDGVASQIFASLGVSLDEVKAEVMRLIGRKDVDDTKPAGMSVADAIGYMRKHLLYMEGFTDATGLGGLTKGRIEEMRRLLNVIEQKG